MPRDSQRFCGRQVRDERRQHFLRAVCPVEVAVSDEDRELIEEMFVQLARGLSGEENVVTLRGVAPSTLYFSDRPARVVGHMTNEQFLDQWAKGPDSFEDDPPNAVISFTDAAGQLEDIVVTLAAPRLDGDSLRYNVTVLEGAVPVSAGPCTVFIDPLGRPLSPVSVAGMHRRERRRMRRRTL